MILMMLMWIDCPKPDLLSKSKFIERPRNLNINEELSSQLN